ncbi:MAG: hypothetical protein HY718_04655 [Planctomycetes bacterium]|nr:hypothetical protein [Planctomycetota bacterium]
MKRMLFVLLVMVACSGQFCGEAAPTETGPKNICDRSWYSDTFRIGVDFPADIGEQRNADAVEGLDLNLSWNWNVIDPPVKFSLVVFQPAQENTLVQFRQAWLDALEEDGNFDILNEAYITLDDGAQGWYLAIARKDKPGVINELVMTVTQGRSAYVSAAYSTELVSEAQVDQIGDVLHSFCADLE